MKFDGGDPIRVAKRLVMMMSGVIGIREGLVAFAAQVGGTSCYLISRNEHVEIDHHALGGIGIEAGEEMGRPLQEYWNNMDFVEHRREFDGLAHELLVPLTIENGHAVEEIHHVLRDRFDNILVSQSVEDG